MTAPRPKFKVDPDLCKGCAQGRRDCVRACKLGALKIGPSYIYVDWDVCDGCLGCVEMCDTGALSAPVESTRAVAQAASVPGPQRPRPRVADAGDGRARGGLADRADVRSVWTPFDALAVLLVIMASLLALDRVIGLPIVNLMPPSGRVLARVVGLGVTYGIDMLAVWVLARRHHVSLAPALGIKPLSHGFSSLAASTGLVLVLLFASRAISTLYGLVTQSYGWEPVIRWDTDLTRVFGAGKLGMVLAIALVGVIGPFVEEVVFRGVVQSALTKRSGAIWGVGTTSVLFATYHFDAWMFVPMLLLGVALGWLAEKRHGLWPSIALHVLYNGVTIFAVFWVAAH